MRDLNYDLKKLCQYHEYGSYATRYAREQILALAANQLHECGFRHLQAKNLKPKHVEALVTRWKAEGLSGPTMKNRLCAIRWWAARIDKKPVVARTNDAYGIGSREYVAKVSKARVLSADELGRIITDPYSALSLRLQAAFGLRRVESIKIQPDWADRGDKLVLKSTWCMERREREIPIRNALQRAVLDDAKMLAGPGSLIPQKMSYVEQLHRFRAQCMKVGIRRAHGHRDAYAEERYREIAGRDCPAGGGKPTLQFSEEEKALDLEARRIISRELGHKSIKATVAYLGR